jgi:antitoxin ParD1/3/4
MNVSLTPELEAFIEKEVGSGMYQSASEVVRAGLRLLKDEKSPSPHFMVSSMDALEDKLAVGIRQLDRGEGLPGEIAAEHLRKRASARRERNG